MSASLPGPLLWLSPACHRARPEDRARLRIAALSHDALRVSHVRSGFIRAIYQNTGGSAPLRPLGAIRHYAGMLSRDAATGLSLVFERDARQRLGQAGSVSLERLRERLRPTRARMRVLQAVPGGRLRWQTVPVPGPPALDAATVRPIASSTCDIDCMIALGRGQFALPLHLGHECVAEVLEVGERVTSVRAGDRVVVPFQINCGECSACKAGRTGNCTGVPPVSMYGMGLVGGLWGGAFAEQLCVPFADAMLVPLPDGVDPVAVASVADNICDAYRHIGPHLPRMLDEEADSDVVVLAAPRRRFYFSGSLPLYVGLLARAFGARRVRLIDARPAVREHAARLGIEALDPRDARGLEPARLVADCSGGDLELALSLTAPDGVCTSSGSMHRSARIPTLQMYMRNVTIHFGRTHARALMPTVLELIAAGKLDPSLVVTNVAPLSEAPSALGDHIRGGGIKTVLTALA